MSLPAKPATGDTTAGNIIFIIFPANSSFVGMKLKQNPTLAYGVCCICKELQLLFFNLHFAFTLSDHCFSDIVRSWCIVAELHGRSSTA